MRLSRCDQWELALGMHHDKSSKAMFKRDKDLIFELERYNEIGELLIGNRTTGSQGHVIQRLEGICN